MKTEALGWSQNRTFGTFNGGSRRHTEGASGMQLNWFKAADNSDNLENENTERFSCEISKFLKDLAASCKFFLGHLLLKREANSL